MTSLLFPGLTALALVLASTAVPMVRRVALRAGFVDDPAAASYKTHARPTPYGGGLAIWLGAVLPLAGLLAWLVSAQPSMVHDGIEWVSPWAPYSFLPLEPWSPSVMQVSQVLCALAGATALLLLGLADDRRNLPPGVRFGGQAVLALGLSLWVPGFRFAPLGVPPAVGVAAAAFWIVALANAFNFLDNMNGLAAGLAMIGLGTLGAIALAAGHLPAALACLAVAGASAGFLLHNFPAASIFMGDAGGLFLGFLSGSLSVLLCGVLGPSAGDDALLPVRLLPLLAFAVPVYDLVTVIALRLQRGARPWVGDRNHVSHRLVALGLGRTRAVLVLYALAAATAFPCAVAIRAGLGVAWWAVGGVAAILAAFGAVDAALARRRAR